MSDPYAALDATAQADLVRTGDVSPLELVDAAIARIEAVDPTIHAFTTTRFEAARAEATAGLPDGPFRGVPFALKDLACTLADEPAYDGVRVLKDTDWRAPVTSTLAARFQAAGLVVMGRTSTPELGIMPTTEPLCFEPTRNPWNAAYIAGGSSGGSAAAVAAGLVPFAHASDGGGSIRIPAACCGLVGLKTSRGRTSVGPASDEIARPLSVQFAVTRSVRDAAALLDAVAGPAVGDPVTPAAPSAPFVTALTASTGALRIGLMTTLPGTSDPADAECVAATEAVARALEAAGHHVEVTHPAAFDETERMTAFIPIWSAMATSNLIAIGRKIGRDVTADDVEPLTWLLSESGRQTSGGELMDALSAMGAFSRRFTQWWADGWDLLLTPTLGELPPELGVLQTPEQPLLGFGRGGNFTPFTPVTNQTGQPAISLPVAQSASGLPIGVHFIAAPGREDLLLSIGAFLESALPWADRRAPTMPDARTVRLGGGQGFYGDTPRAVAGLLDAGVDYLCLEALAELTLAILQKDRAKDETLGYTRDLPRYLGAAMPAIVDGRTKVVTNAGGINPRAAAHAAVETAKALGVSGLKVATVLGDDLMTRLPEVRAATASGLANIETGAAFDTMGGEALFCSAYIGAFPIAEALAQGADIVITGRVADAALFLGPLIFEHGWARDDWDHLAAGILVGHLLECSGQVAGGNFSGDWWTVPDPWKLPYPIADVAADGTAVISKPADAGGRVDVDTVRHQLLYEVHDPAAYLSPDVVADFTSAQFTDLGADRVEVRDVRGRPATDSYKALLAYPAGWAGETRIAFAWPDAVEKAQALTAIFMQRVEMAGLTVDAWEVELWGVNALGGDTVPPTAAEPPEVVARVAWRCGDQKTAALVGRELVPLALSAPPAGMTGMGRAGGSATELLGIWPTLVDKSLVDPHVTVTLEEI